MGDYATYGELKKDLIEVLSKVLEDSEFKVGINHGDIVVRTVYKLKKPLHESIDFSSEQRILESINGAEIIKEE